MRLLVIGIVIMDGHAMTCFSTTTFWNLSFVNLEIDR